MSKSEILAELPKLPPADRMQLLERLCELQEMDLLAGAAPSKSDRELLNKALAEFERDGDPGRPWREVLKSLRAAGNV